LVPLQLSQQRSSAILVTGQGLLPNPRNVSEQIEHTNSFLGSGLFVFIIVVLSERVPGFSLDPDATLSARSLDANPFVTDLG
jgi:hypothetical protein